MRGEIERGRGREGERDIWREREEREDRVIERGGDMEGRRREESDRERERERERRGWT